MTEAHISFWPVSSSYCRVLEERNTIFWRVRSATLGKDCDTSQHKWKVIKYCLLPVPGRPFFVPYTPPPHTHPPVFSSQNIRSICRCFHAKYLPPSPMKTPKKSCKNMPTFVSKLYPPHLCRFAPEVAQRAKRCVLPSILLR